MQLERDFRQSTCREGGIVPLERAQEITEVVEGAVAEADPLELGTQGDDLGCRAQKDLRRIVEYWSKADGLDGSCRVGLIREQALQSMQVGRPDSRADDEQEPKVLDPVAYSLEKIRLLTGFEKGGESSGGGFEVQIVVESEFNSLAETRVDSAD